MIYYELRELKFGALCPFQIAGEMYCHDTQKVNTALGKDVALVCYTGGTAEDLSKIE